MCKYSDCATEINRYFINKTNPSFSESAQAFAFKVHSTNVVGIYYDNIVYYYSITKLTNETDKALIKRLGVEKIVYYIQEHINSIMNKHGVDRNRILYKSYRNDENEMFTYNSITGNVISLTKHDAMMLCRRYNN